MVDNSIWAFKNWDEVIDYESDENSVTLIGKNNIPIAEYGYSRFTGNDYEKFKNQILNQ